MRATLYDPSTGTFTFTGGMAVGRQEHSATLLEDGGQASVLNPCHGGSTIAHMDTVTFKLERRHIQRVKDQAKASGRSQAAVVRDLIEEHLGPKMRPSLHEQARDLCGSVALPRDASVRALNGYGHD